MRGRARAPGDAQKTTGKPEYSIPSGPSGAAAGREPLRQNRETDSAVASSGVSGNARFAIEVEVAVARVGRRAARIAHVTRFSEQAKPQRNHDWTFIKKLLVFAKLYGRDRSTGNVHHHQVACQCKFKGLGAAVAASVIKTLHPGL